MFLHSSFYGYQLLEMYLKAILFISVLIFHFNALSCEGGFTNNGSDLQIVQSYIGTKANQMQKNEITHSAGILKYLENYFGKKELVDQMIGKFAAEDFINILVTIQLTTLKAIFFKYEDDFFGNKERVRKHLTSSERPALLINRVNTAMRVVELVIGIEAGKEIIKNPSNFDILFGVTNADNFRAVLESIRSRAASKEAVVEMLKERLILQSVAIYWNAESLNKVTTVLENYIGKEAVDKLIVSKKGIFSDPGLSFKIKSEDLKRKLDFIKSNFTELLTNQKFLEDIHTALTQDFTAFNQVYHFRRDLESTYGFNKNRAEEMVNEHFVTLLKLYFKDNMVQFIPEMVKSHSTDQS